MPLIFSQKSLKSTCFVLPFVKMSAAIVSYSGKLLAVKSFLSIFAYSLFQYLL